MIPVEHCPDRQLGQILRLDKRRCLQEPEEMMLVCRQFGGMFQKSEEMIHVHAVAERNTKNATVPERRVNYDTEN